MVVIGFWYNTWVEKYYSEGLGKKWEFRPEDYGINKVGSRPRGLEV